MSVSVLYAIQRCLTVTLRPPRFTGLDLYVLNPRMVACTPVFGLE